MALDFRLSALMASGGENGCFENLILGQNFNMNHYWDLFEPQITNRYEFPIFGASPIGGRTWKNENLNRLWLLDQAQTCTNVLRSLRPLI
jgi:hypothetical protein